MASCEAMGGPAADSLDLGDVDRGRALGALLRLVRHLRALCEGLEALGVDARVVDEEVLASVVRRDEAEALVIAEPLDGSGCHVVFLHGSCASRTWRCSMATTTGA